MSSYTSHAHSFHTSYRLFSYMLGIRGGIAPTIPLFYTRNVCLLFNRVAPCAICIGLASEKINGKYTSPTKILTTSIIVIMWYIYVHTVVMETKTS